MEALEARAVPSAVRPGFNTSILARTDDGSTSAVNIGFTLDFFSANYSQLFVNNNGNVTFGGALTTYTPFGLTGATSRPIIAPYFADVDTTNASSGVTAYGTGTVNGHPAFGVTWPGVGYYSNKADKLNTFQVVLISRPDTGANNFDIEFNYDQVKWETGDASGGVSGLGGSSARAGFSNGTGTTGTFYEFVGSGSSGAFLDGNAATGLKNNSLNSGTPAVAGRYVFAARSGALPVNHPPVIQPIGNKSVNEGSALSFTASASDIDAGTALTYSLVGAPTGASINASTGAFAWTPTEDQGPGNYTFTVRVSDNGSPTQSDEEAVTVTVNEFNRAPTLAPIGNRTVDEGTPLTFTATATDPDLPPNTLTYSLIGAPAGATIGASSGQFAWTPTESQGPGNYTFTVRVSDGTNVDDEQITVTVNEVNGAPVLGAIGEKAVDEGSTLTVQVSGTDPDVPANALTFSLLNPPAGASVNPATGLVSFTPADQGDYQITVRAVDNGNPPLSGTVTFAVTAVNVAPTATLTAPATGAEGTAFAVSLTGTADASTADKDAGFEYAFDFGTGYGGWSASSTASFTPPDDGAYAVKAKVRDKDGGVTEYTAALTVTNAAPTVDAGAGAALSEGGAFGGSGSFADPGADTWTATVDYGDGTGSQPLTLTGKGFTLSHTYADNGTYTVTVTVTDDDGGVGADTAQVAVGNVAPTAGPVVAPQDPTARGTVVAATASFSDPGVRDTHTATWDWGDGTTSAGGVAEAGGSGSVSGSHAYATAGVYTVRLTVTDKDTGSSVSTFQYVVVYDPSAGFVTGGGWFTSPAGAYPAAPALTGRADFGFVSRYKPGATVPEGNTQFQFKAAGLRLQSTAYDWLVVSGAKARYRGVGEVNGVGGFAFELTAWDGDRTGGGTDRIRLQIWDGNRGNAVVYDNLMGGADGADPTTVLGGGSIQIHTSGSQPLLAAATPATPGAAPKLSQADLRRVWDEAVRRWEAAGLDAGQTARLRAAEVRVADLGGADLGRAWAGEWVVQVDDDAAGWGWFADPTPADDAEFAVPGDQGEQGRIDLLSVLTHELGHLLGLADDHDPGHADEVMGEALGTGTRRLPDAAEVVKAVTALPVYAYAPSLTPALAAKPRTEPLAVSAPPQRGVATPQPAEPASAGVRPTAGPDPVARRWATLPAGEFWGVPLDPRDELG